MADKVRLLIFFITEIRLKRGTQIRARKLENDLQKEEKGGSHQERHNKILKEKPV